MTEIYKRLKQLRIEHNLTQTEVATALNVTTQAVSKWESQTTLPDISQLVPLADFYGVTVDYLLGHNPDSAAEEISGYLETCDNSLNTRNKEEWALAIDETKRMLRKYPKEYRLMAELCGELFMQHRCCTNPKYLFELCDYGEVILAECTDEKIRHSAVKWLIYAYKELKLYEKAKKLADEMPPLSLSQEALEYYCAEFGTEEHLYSAQVFTNKCIDEVISTILQYICNDEKENFTAAEKLSLCTTVCGIVNAYYPCGDYDYVVQEQLYKAELYAAKYTVILGRNDMCLTHLKNAVTHVSEIRNGTENIVSPAFTSPFAKLLDTRYTAFQKSHFKTLFEKITGDAAFNSIRETAEFRKAENEVLSLCG